MNKIFIIIIISSASLIVSCSNSNEFVDSNFCSNIEKDYSKIYASLNSKEINLIKDRVQFEGEIVWDKTKKDGTKNKKLDISKMLEYGFQPEINLQ